MRCKIESTIVKIKMQMKDYLNIRDMLVQYVSLLNYDYLIGAVEKSGVFSIA